MKRDQVNKIFTAIRETRKTFPTNCDRLVWLETRFPALLDTIFEIGWVVGIAQVNVLQCPCLPSLNNMVSETRKVYVIKDVF